MEIIEIVSSKVNLDKNILEVSFRTNQDSEDEIREDKIDYNLVDEYGYILEDESFDFFSFGDDEDEEYEFDEFEDVQIDENELMSFLNEYYMVNPDNLPRAESF